MSHAIIIPDELYRTIEEYAARRGESAEAAVLAWAASLKQSSATTTEAASTESASPIDDPLRDPWAGFRGMTAVHSPDSIDRHDAYLAEEYMASHEPER